MNDIYSACFLVAMNGVMRRESHPAVVVKMSAELAALAVAHLNEREETEDASDAPAIDLTADSDETAHSEKTDETTDGEKSDENTSDA